MEVDRFHLSCGFVYGFVHFFKILAAPHTYIHTSGADPGFDQGGGQLLRPKVADIVKQSRKSEASNLQLGSRAHLRTLETFGFLMLKYAFSHILETLFL